jgi:hypothetical protein
MGVESDFRKDPNFGEIPKYLVELKEKRDEEKRKAKE